MVSVGVHEAKTHLSKLLVQVEAGEEVVICRSGKPIARLVPTEPEVKPRRVFGQDVGRIWMAEDFNDPLPDEILDLFYS